MLQKMDPYPTWSQAVCAQRSWVAGKSPAVGYRPYHSASSLSDNLCTGM